MNKIKLLQLNELDNGTIRLQSQLLVGSNTADFILENGILKNWGKGANGFDFYQTNISFEIVFNKSDMLAQTL